MGNDEIIPITEETTASPTSGKKIISHQKGRGLGHVTLKNF